VVPACTPTHTPARTTLQAWVLPEWHSGLSWRGIATAAALLALPPLHLASSFTNPGYIEPPEPDDDDDDLESGDAEAGKDRGEEGGFTQWSMVCTRG